MGLAYVAPIGLQNIFVINSALGSRLPRALVTAIIVISFDITLSLACFFGIGLLMERCSWLKTVITFAGSIIVMAIGIRLLISRPEAPGEDAETMPIVRTITSACVVTWLNPQALIDGTMMLGAFHAALMPSETAPFIIGVCTASMTWFLSLTVILSLFSRHFTARMLRVINIICGGIITLYGIALLAKGIL